MSTLRSSRDPGAPEIHVRISPVIEREFKRRGVFPELRLDAAVRVINGVTGVHRITLERAREILADAETQNRNRALLRGVPVAYGALARQLDAAIKEEARRGLWDDPGMEEVKQRQAEASACFAVGDRVVHFMDGEEYGREATVVGGYRMYSVLGENGPYITPDDQRFEYRRGYVIKVDGSDQSFFAPAHRLTRDDCKPAHLRLVASRHPGSNAHGSFFATGTGKRTRT